MSGPVSIGDCGSTVVAELLLFSHSWGVVILVNINV